MTKRFGNLSEDLVVEYLIKQGFSILERNYKKFFGEIDIIAKRNNIIAFIEVKARKKDNNLMYRLVDHRKQHKIGMVARLFISNFAHNYKNITYRFDVALVLGDEGFQNITYIPNAYSLSEN
ncbi:YraN family protein [Candidatus Dependentiae bacterium]|nr:YraN family protein [Candidatus Dependentiae bacterium]